MQCIVYNLYKAPPAAYTYCKEYNGIRKKIAVEYFAVTCKLSGERSSTASFVIRSI